MSISTSVQQLWPSEVFQVESCLSAFAIVYLSNRTFSPKTLLWSSLTSYSSLHSKVTCSETTFLATPFKIAPFSTIFPCLVTLYPFSLLYFFHCCFHYMNFLCMFIGLLLFLSHMGEGGYLFCLVYWERGSPST